MRVVQVELEAEVTLPMGVMPLALRLTASNTWLAWVKTRYPLMLPPIDFISYVLRSPAGEDQKVMAMVALNTLFDVEQFPVDLSQVMALGTNNRIMTRAFLAWCAIEPKEYLSQSLFLSRNLRKVVDPDFFQEEECTP